MGMAYVKDTLLGSYIEHQFGPCKAGIKTSITRGSPQNGRSKKSYSETETGFAQDNLVVINTRRSYVKDQIILIERDNYIKYKRL